MFENRKGYEIALRMAAVALGSIDPELAASERLVRFDADARTFVIPFLGTEVLVKFPGGEVRGRQDEKLSGAVAVLALHYLLYKGEPLSKSGWLAYRDMPGARQFASAFESMAESRIAGRFGRDADGFRSAAVLIGGIPCQAAPLSFEIPALPRVPVTVVLWEAAEGIEGTARLLFKPSAPYYLHSEDLAALGAVLAERLISAA